MSAGGTDTQAAGLTHQVDPDMEQILASIRRIISDDQKALGIPLEPRPIHRARPLQAAPQRQPVRKPGRDAQKPEQQALDGEASARTLRPPRATATANVAFHQEPDRSRQPSPASARDDVAHYRPHDDDGIDAGLHRISTRDGQSEDLDTGLPPRSTQRPAVRLTSAPPVDYRPPEVRARAMAPDRAPEEIDAHLAEIIGRAVTERVNEAMQSGALEIGRLRTGASQAVAREPVAAGAYAPFYRGHAYDAAAPAFVREQYDDRGSHAAPSRMQGAYGERELRDDQPDRRASSSTGGVAWTRRGVSEAGVPAALHADVAPFGALVTPAAAARISSAFDALTQRVAAERARTMEETVTDMLRPMLAQWLETNLPDIVERLVSEQVNLLSGREPD